jgi:hypothetical protein
MSKITVVWTLWVPWFMRDVSPWTSSPWRTETSMNRTRFRNDSKIYKILRFSPFRIQLICCHNDESYVLLILRFKVPMAGSGRNAWTCWRLTLILLMWRIRWAPNSIPIYEYIQKDATLHSLFISGNCSICFGWYFHPSSGAHTTVPTESGICHTVTVICRYRGRVGTGLSVLWVAYATHSTLS